MNTKEIRDHKITTRDGRFWVEGPHLPRPFEKRNPQDAEKFIHWLCDTEAIEIEPVDQSAKLVQLIPIHVRKLGNNQYWSNYGDYLVETEDGFETISHAPLPSIAFQRVE